MNEATIVARMVASKVAGAAVQMLQETVEQYRDHATAPTQRSSQRYTPRYERPQKPCVKVSDYGDALLQASLWQKGRQASATAIFQKGTQKLFIGQFGVECSALLLDTTVKKCKWELGQMTEAGESGFRKFEVLKGTMDQVAKKLQHKGWQRQPLPYEQFELTPLATAA